MFWDKEIYCNVWQLYPSNPSNPLFGQFWVKTKVTWEDKDKSSEAAAPQSILSQTALHSLTSVFKTSNTLTLFFLPSESSLFPLSSDRQIEFLHNKIKC